MALDAINQTRTQSPADTGLNATNAAASSERFLKLLVAQLQNQDPLNPMDNAQVTSQMAQINTVTGIEKLNTTVEGLSGQFVQLQAMQGASLVGRDVIVPGNVVDINEAGVGQGGFELSSPADAVKVEILSPSGQVVKTLELGAKSAGLHSFDWDAQGATNEAGLKFRVSSRLGSVSTVATPLMRDTVSAVSTSGTGFSLELARGGSQPYSAVKAFN